MGIIDDTTSTIGVSILLVVLSFIVYGFASTMTSLPGGHAAATLINNAWSAMVSDVGFALVAISVIGFVVLLLWFIDTIYSSSHDVF